jgi:peptide/nickel transport system permease protein
MVPLLIVVSAFVFILGQYGAGDMAMQLTLQIKGLGNFDPVLYQQLRHDLGLDKPVLVRFAEFISGAVRGDFGRSYVLPGNPEIGPTIRATLPVSAQLALAAIVIVAAVGIPLGILAAVLRNTPLDYAIVTAVTILSSIPAYVLIPLALVLLVIELRLVPTVGMGWKGLLHREVLLPAFLLAIGPIMGVVRYTRAQVADVLQQEYVWAARARGLSEWKVIARHVVRNAMTPVVTVLGMTAAHLLSGSIFVESAFGYRGFGQVAIEAFRGGDIQTVAAVTLVSAIIVMLANLVVDLLYGVIDPRVRLHK